MTGVLPLDTRPWHWQTHAFASPRNAYLQDKPVADCATPISSLREEYWARRYGSSPGMWVHASLTHWLLIPEIYPYLESYSTWDCCFWNWGALNFSWGNLYISRKSAGQVNPANPRTAWAHKVVLWTSLARLQVAWLIGICGFFYGYEFAYTYIPFVKIKDPSPEGWKKGWQEDQSTFMARGLACLTTPVAFYAWKGTWKRAGFLMYCHLFIQMYYEMGRCYVHNGSTKALYYQAHRDASKYERHGSLTPETQRIGDPQSNKPSWAFSYQTMRMNHSATYDLTLANKNHDYQPLSNYSCIIPNPYYDFQKAAQMNEPVKARWKSEVWKMPSVMNTMMMSGVQDATA